MSRQFFKIGALALLAVIIVWGTMAAQKAAGGGNNPSQDIPLKATFLAGSFGPFGPFGYVASKITNDPNGPYVHQGTKTGQTQIYILQPNSAGRLIMIIYRSAPGSRYQNLHFDTMLYPPVARNELPPECECLEPYFIYPTIQSRIQTTYFHLETTMECQRFDYVDDKGPYVDLVPMDRQYLNLAKMLPGETKYACGWGNCIRFRPMDDPNTAKYDESYDYYNLFVEPQFFVVKAYGNQSGIAYWTITPFAERFKAIDKEDGFLKDYNYGCVPRRVTSSSYRSCNHGTFMMPFELKIERLK
jgi:hypothetical protein